MICHSACSLRRTEIRLLRGALASDIDVARGDLPWMWRSWRIPMQLFNRFEVSRALDCLLCFQTSYRMLWAARMKLQAMLQMADDTTDRADSFSEAAGRTIEPDDGPLLSLVQAVRWPTNRLTKHSIIIQRAR